VPNSRNYLARRRLRALAEAGVTRLQMSAQSGLGRKTFDRILFPDHWGHHVMKPETLRAIYRIKFPHQEWHPVRLRCGRCLCWRPCPCDPERSTRYSPGGFSREE
jgi:hypothetical protein